MEIYSWIILTAFTTVLYHPRGAEYYVRVKNYLQEKYNRFIRPWQARRSGESPSLIQVSKKGDKTLVFTDVELSSSAGTKKSYRVELECADTNVTLAEIDFSDWRTHFGTEAITITDLTQRSHQLNPDTNRNEYARVLAKLQELPLLLSNPTLYPDDTIKKLKKVWSNGDSTLATGINNLQKLLDDLGRFIGVSEGVSTNQVDPQGNYSAHLSTQEFFLRLLKVVEATDDPQLLENFFTVITNSLQNEVALTNKLVGESEAVVAKSKRELERAQIYMRIAIGVAILSLIFVVAMFIVAPPAAGLIATTVLIFSNILMGRIAEGFSLLGILKGAFIGIISVGLAKFNRSVVAYKKVVAEQNIRELKETQKNLQQTLEAVTTQKTQLLAVLTTIRNIIDAREPILDLHNSKPPNNMKNFTVDLIAEYLVSGKLAECTTIILAANDIRATEVSILAAAVKTQTAQSRLNIKTLDLRDNNIGIDGVEELLSALTENLTLTTVHYDTSFRLEKEATNGEAEETIPVPIELQDKISRELMINRYLQGEDFGQFVDSERDRLFPQGEAELIRAVTAKLQNNSEVEFPTMLLHPKFDHVVEEMLERKSLTKLEPEKLINKFLDGYSRSKDSSSYLNVALKQVAGLLEQISAFLEKDINSGCVKLQQLGSEQRRGLLEAYLDRQQPHADALALLISELVGVNPATYKKYIEHIFPKKSWKTIWLISEEAWDINKYIEQLQKLGKTAPALAPQLTPIIEATLQVLKPQNSVSEETTDTPREQQEQEEFKPALDLTDIEQSNLKEQLTAATAAEDQPHITTLQHTLQVALEERLRARFSCLTAAPEELSSMEVWRDNFNRLKYELSTNYDLYNPKFVQHKKLPRELVAYVEFICHRNILRRHMESADLAGFMQAYAKVPEVSYEQVLAQFTSHELLHLLAKDLGNPQEVQCHYLRGLSWHQRVPLLARSFSEVESQAAVKAELLAKLLEIDILFMPQYLTEPLVTLARKAIFSALSPRNKGGQSVPLYDIDKLIGSLHRVVENITEAASPELQVLKEKVQTALAALPDEVEVVSLEPSAQQNEVVQDQFRPTQTLADMKTPPPQNFRKR